MIGKLLILLYSVTCAFGAGCLEVSGRWVTAHDFRELIPGFGKLAAETQLLPSPWTHSRRIVSHRELAGLAQKYAVVLSDTQGEICIEAVSLPLERSRVETAVEQELASLRGEEIVEATIIDFNPKKVPVGNLVLGNAGLMSGLNSQESRPIARFP